MTAMTTALILTIIIVASAADLALTLVVAALIARLDNGESIA